MIESISISNVASYDAAGVTLDDLKKINFIYGANGCGKTTISRYLYDQSHSDFSTCHTQWTANTPYSVLSYNKEFREKNFGSGKIAGVFTLGQATQEELDLIAQKKAALKELKEQNIQKFTTLSKQEEKLEAEQNQVTDSCWALYKKYEKDFKEALRGSISSKVSFKQKLFDESQTNTSDVEDITSLRDRSNSLLAERPSRLSLLSQISFEAIEPLEQNELWQKVIVGKSDVMIADLISKIGHSDWVSQGRDYLVDESHTCPFCQHETIDHDFRAQLEEYFDDSFETEKTNLSESLQKYKDEYALIISKLEQISSSESVNSDTKLEIEAFQAHLRAITSIYAKNCALIDLKISKPSQAVELDSSIDELTSIKKLITEANELIQNHNDLVDNYAEEVERLKSSIWKFLADELSTVIEGSTNKQSGLLTGIQSIQADIDQRKQNITDLEQELILLNRNVTSVQPAVDEINRLLRAYGFTSFKISPYPEEENHYAIQRECGSFAHETLSEGEVTFITFLYFVQLAKGALDQEGVTEDRVLVIDDPISSLDSNVLFIVSSIIKDMVRETKEDTGNCRQLFILTHNVYFHKEASFQNGRSNGDADTHFWILRKSADISSVHPYGQKNPIESSYELLWREIKDWERNSGITLQNTMRRIIENYFKILGKLGDDDLIEKFTTFEEKQVCRSLLCWINDGSHTIPDDLFVQAPDDSAEQYQAVFKKIFEHTGNSGHYEMMMGES
ncbi:AAA family ATPase [Neptuniibacter caesariensis]|uniref:Protein CR006 P-loop domain-containing protein n=1 Tax=Neptuniibacter caesariensis TaxID=207954 RepID=A0A7U8C8W9_NEPCE|nr:AAA family ATPase [Neptuniibacter caesariensis]EAR62046.1 hypothetical protein MED92_10084 [Oceanospirillum sp. MED92] [Neptuniibacter caesariensis]